MGNNKKHYEPIMFPNPWDAWEIVRPLATSKITRNTSTVTFKVF